MSSVHCGPKRPQLLADGDALSFGMTGRCFGKNIVHTFGKLKDSQHLNLRQVSDFFVCSHRTSETCEGAKMKTEMVYAFQHQGGFNSMFSEMSSGEV